MVASVNAVPLDPQVELPEDHGLPELPKLFDGEWVWQLVCERLTREGSVPRRIRVRQFSHTPGRTATAGYVAEWPDEDYLPPEHFTLQLEHDKPAKQFHYPQDPDLPGLVEAAHPDSALRLMNAHVFAVPRRRVRVDMVRYRPGSRAVLRHRTGKVRFYARVVRPRAIPGLLSAAELIGNSRFAVPRVAGCWADGGVLWLSEIPGKNVRDRMRRGKPPDPGVLLDGLESLWETPDAARGGRPFNLRSAYRRAGRTFRHALRDHDEGRRAVARATRALGPFVESWQPSTIAHNDFYDDQMLVLPDGRVALVDFEEAGPGDPMLDVGNFLAHLLWASRFGRRRRNDASGAYYEVFRDAALDRFHWTERDLGFREAVCLFRICTNTIRRPQADWLNTTIAGLGRVNQLLD